MVDINYNINLTFGNRGLSSNLVGGVLGAGVDEVGFLAATNRQRRLRQNLRRDFVPIVDRELVKMARDISRMAIGTNGALTAPRGVLRIDGRVSEALSGQASAISLSSMTGSWAARSPKYLRWKYKNYRTRKWFQNTGRLKQQLANVGTYRSAYGPIRISFTPKTIQNSRGNVSGLGRSRGGQSRNIQIGRLEVEPLRRLRASDLPEIGTVANYNAGLMMPLADSVEKKLTGRAKNSYRPVLEPFLTYYLTRKIPNKVFLKIEDSLLA